MPYPTGAGVVSYSGDYIPELWPSLLIVNWNDISIVPDITNRNYEGVIKAHGDKLNIRTTPRITSSAYVVGSLGTPEQPKSAPLVMYIDKGSKYNFVLPLLTARQMDIDAASVLIGESAISQKNFIEDDVLGSLAAEADATNIGNTAGAKSGGYVLGATNTPVAVTATNIVDAIFDAEAALDENNVPDEGRFICLPSIVGRMINTSELKDCSLTGDAKSPMRTGAATKQIGKFRLFKTNRVSQVTDGAWQCWHCLFGHSYATTFATQITSTREIPYSEDMGTLYQGIQSYGWKVTKKVGLGDLYVRKG